MSMVPTAEQGCTSHASFKCSPEVGCTCACLQLVRLTPCWPTKILKIWRCNATAKVAFYKVIKINENIMNDEVFKCSVSWRLNKTMWSIYWGWKMESIVLNKHRITIFTQVLPFNFNKWLDHVKWILHLFRFTNYLVNRVFSYI